MFSKLNKQQSIAVQEENNALVVACPGSGKTRVLTCKVAHELEKLESSKQYVVALTFTNRAADEIQRRIDMFAIKTEQLWTGTIHSFCLEWILRPYMGYLHRIANGFTVIDEYTKEQLIDKIKKGNGVKQYLDVVTNQDRDGKYCIENTLAKKIVDEYHQILLNEKCIDFDLILYLSYRLLCDNQEIARILANIFKLICVDEYQDTQDLQYGILGEIIKAGEGNTRIFLVGDPDQAIYGSLGGMAKSVEEIQDEIGGLHISKLKLTGNYRSSQRIIDYYRNFQLTDIQIVALGNMKLETGLITLNSVISKDTLHIEIARLIKLSLEKGMPEHEICVMAPRWYMLTELARKLKNLLPDVNFDAPGLSPMRKNKENIWFKISRLFLTDPSPSMYLTRLRWAKEILLELDVLCSISLIGDYKDSKNLLKLINSIVPDEEQGIPYLKIAFTELMRKLNISLIEHEALVKHWNSFFNGAEERLAREDIPKDVISFRNMFKKLKGIVVNTCHGVKGEEYETVISYGLLYGYVPHWSDIIGRDLQVQVYSANKLLYVICSRAKKNLHLIVELGRKTNTGNYYRINTQLSNVKYDYDSI